ncbi:hypothetical protein CSUB01_05575 [Colletotrichum sublineola]|uniref:Uncharacterized protein n=1 Tax=Colletotrichum sublineola TaxID=1173701 RepID=A0A066WXW4_COLSU|nr:hypothetical protein CSUB01_05575 [Colletotrichum sublineola]
MTNKLSYDGRITGWEFGIVMFRYEKDVLCRPERNRQDSIDKEKGFAVEDAILLGKPAIIERPTQTLRRNQRHAQYRAVALDSDAPEGMATTTVIRPSAACASNQRGNLHGVLIWKGIISCRVCLREDKLGHVHVQLLKPKNELLPYKHCSTK